jgi:hypothetical protein
MRGVIVVVFVALGKEAVSVISVRPASKNAIVRSEAREASLPNQACSLSLRCNRLEGNAARLSGLAVRLHDYLNVLLEHGEHFHQAFGRIVVKVAAK